MRRLQSLASLYLEYRFRCLFFSLLLTMVAAPVLAALGVKSVFVEVFLLLNLLAAIYSTEVGRFIHIGLGLMLLSFLVRTGYTIFDMGQLLPVHQGLAIAAFLMTVFFLFRFIFSQGTINAERIFACLSLYLLMGVVFGILFLIVEELHPNSLAVQAISRIKSGHPRHADALYFSFVTLGTLGYGDIVPISGPARALAVSEALIGQMYLAVVVARLVALHQGGSSTSRRRDQTCEKQTMTGDAQDFNPPP